MQAFTFPILPYHFLLDSILPSFNMTKDSYIYIFPLYSVIWACVFGPGPIMPIHLGPRPLGYFMWVGVNIDINVFIFVYMISLYSFHIGNMRNNKEPTGS